MSLSSIKEELRRSTVNLRLPKQASLIIQSVTAATVLSYCFYHLFWGEPLVALFAGLTSASAICSIRETSAERSDVVCLSLFSVFAGITAVFTSYYFGYRGLIFLFPYITALVFIFTPRLALGLGVSIAIASLIAAMNVMPVEQIVRYSIPLALTVLLTMGYAAKMLQQQQSLWREANQDWLTGIMSRKRFTERFTQFLESKHGQDGRFGMVFIDLDNFKSINDKYGHAAGDYVLRQVARRLESEALKLSPNNVCDAQELPVVRLSGDEFALMVCCAENEQSVLETAQQAAATLRGNYNWPGEQINLEVSVGVFVGRYSEETTESSLAKADAAMYFAKRDPSSQGIRLFDDEVARSADLAAISRASQSY